MPDLPTLPYFTLPYLPIPHLTLSLTLGTDYDDHVLEGRRSQGGLTPNSLEFDLLGAFRC